MYAHVITSVDPSMDALKYGSVAHPTVICVAAARFVPGYNPANWMLEVTAPGLEKNMGLDFAQIYQDSPLNAKNKAQLDKECMPTEGSAALHFDTPFSVSKVMQFK